MVAITAALVTQPVRGGAINTLVITENNSNSLSAILNGTTALSVSGSADVWTITLTGVFGVGQNWSEPDAARFVNAVYFVPIFPSQLTVVSDADVGASGLTDGTQDTTSFTLNGGALYVTFHDLGDTVPDSGTTCSLFGLSLMGLAFFRRKIPA
jgi:hypothetical protein